MNIGTSTSAPISLALISPNMIPSSTLVVDTLTSIHEVDLVEAMVSLTVEEPISPPTSTKRAQDVGQ